MEDPSPVAAITPRHAGISDLALTWLGPVRDVLRFEQRLAQLNAQLAGNLASMYRCIHSVKYTTPSFAV